MNILHLDDYRSPKEPPQFEYETVKLADGKSIKLKPGMKLYCIYDVDLESISFLDEYIPLSKLLSDSYVEDPILIKSPESTRIGPGDRDLVLDN